MKTRLGFVFTLSLLVIAVAGAWAADHAKPTKAKHIKVSGVVATVDAAANPETITLAAKKGVAPAYTLATDVTVFQGKEKLTPAALAVGQHVQLRGAVAADGTKSVTQIRIQAERHNRHHAAAAASATAPKP